MTKRRLSNREIDELKNIENLLLTVDKGYKNNNIHTQQTQRNHNEFSKIKMTPHALKRAKERFNMDQSIAQGYFKGLLPKAKRIGLQTAKDGGQSILYANGRVGIYVSTDHKEIKTVLKQDVVSFEPIKAKVAELHAKEFRKLTRKENAQEKRLQDSIFEVNAEVASLELRKHKTRSQAVKIACQAKINALKIHINEMKEELAHLKDVKRQIARSMISVV